MIARTLKTNCLQNLRASFPAGGRRNFPICGLNNFPQKLDFNDDPHRGSPLQSRAQGQCKTVRPLHTDEVHLAARTREYAGAPPRMVFVGEGGGAYGPLAALGLPEPPKAPQSLPGQLDGPDEGTLKAR